CRKDRSPHDAILPTDSRSPGLPSSGHGTPGHGAPCPYILFLGSRLFEPGLRQRVGGLGRGETLRARLPEDRMERRRDLTDEPLGLGPVIAFAATLEADQDAHDPTGVNHVVRRVEDAA